MYTDGTVIHTVIMILHWGAVQGASTTTSDPYMALVDEMIDKGSEFSLRGTDDEMDMRSAVEASLGYEDLGAAEQDMRIRYTITA